MTHIRFGPIQQTLEFQTIRISISDYIAHLAHNCSEYEHANQVADNCENISAKNTPAISFLHSTPYRSGEGKAIFLSVEPKPMMLWNNWLDLSKKAAMKLFLPVTRAEGINLSCITVTTLTPYLFNKHDK